MGEEGALHPLERLHLTVDGSALHTKVNSAFHINQPIMLPSFCQGLHSQEKTWHKLEVRRALRIYLDRTTVFSTVRCIARGIWASQLRQKAPKDTLDYWTRQCISKVDEGQEITFHEGSSNVAAFSTRATAEEICRETT